MQNFHWCMEIIQISGKIINGKRPHTEITVAIPILKWEFRLHTQITVTIPILKWTFCI